MDRRPPDRNTFVPVVGFIKRETAYALASLLLLPFLILFIDVSTPLHSLSLLRFSAFSPDDHLGGATCDYSDGRWVRDEGYSDRFYSEGCPFLDPGFQCRMNGRNDKTYLNWRWQPHDCSLPRFNGTEMLERSRNGRIVFVGDSIGRNHWESLVCMLASAIRNQSSIYEANGNPITKHKGFLSIRFDDYNLTVEYYRAPFLVVVGRPPPNSPSQVLRAIRLDTMHWHSKRWVGADALIFNAGHWWNYDKTVKAGGYFMEGNALNMSMDVKEAFQRILETWRLWVLKYVRLDRSYVIFRSYAPSHYVNGTWDVGGMCDSLTEPETDRTALNPEPWNNAVIAGAVRGAGEYMNITHLTELRRDGHPSNNLEPAFRKPFAIQDCSHWCLPGVPDTWNEILYAQLLSKGYDTRKRMRNN